MVAVVIVGLRAVCCEGDLSSGPFFTSLVASCSKRDLRELTDERVESSTDSVLSIVAGVERTFLFQTQTLSSMVADKRHEFRSDRNHNFEFLKRNRLRQVMLWLCGRVFGVDSRERVGCFALPLERASSNVFHTYRFPATATRKI